MSQMRQALLKAGLITENDSKRTEYEAEAIRIFSLHEKGGDTFSKDELEQLSKEAAREAIEKKVPLNKLTGLVLDAIRREKTALAQAKEMAAALEHPSRVTGVLGKAGQDKLIYSVNPCSLARAVKLP